MRLSSPLSSSRAVLDGVPCSVLYHTRAVLCCAGKTHLGLRLAKLYGLLHVNTATILAELQHMDPDTQKVRMHVLMLLLFGHCGASWVRSLVCLGLYEWLAQHTWHRVPVLLLCLPAPYLVGAGQLSRREHPSCLESAHLPSLTPSSHITSPPTTTSATACTAGRHQPAVGA